MIIIAHSSSSSNKISSTNFLSTRERFSNLYSLLSSIQLSKPIYYSTISNQSLVPFQTDQFFSEYNETYKINMTDVLYNVLKNESISSTDDNWSYCNEWTTMQHNLYHTANVIMSLAFLVPATYKQSLLLARILLTISYILLCCYSSNDLCGPDILIWNILFGVINLVHTCILIWKFVPPTFSVELTELYIKVFQPLRVSKQHFKELVKETRMVTLDKGDIYAVEEASPADERLSLLISGKLRVTCDDTHLHFINTHQFLDSPEWEANHEQSDGLFQVTITAEETAVYLCWSRMRLERILRHRPLLKTVLDSIIGKDITQKLYSLNDHMCGLDIERARMKQNVIQEIWAKATRSMSLDSIYTGPTGKVQSTVFRVSADHNKNMVPALSLADTRYTRPQRQTWIPIVANHFPAEFPFARLQEYKAQLILHNAAVLLQTPTQLNLTSRILTEFDEEEATIAGDTQSLLHRTQKEVKFEHMQ